MTLTEQHGILVDEIDGTVQLVAKFTVADTYKQYLEYTDVIRVYRVNDTGVFYVDVQNEDPKCYRFDPDQGAEAMNKALTIAGWGWLAA